jgi:hypothetical protein
LSQVLDFPSKKFYQFFSRTFKFIQIGCHPHYHTSVRLAK